MSNGTETSMTSNDLNDVKLFKTQVEPREPQAGGFTAKWKPFRKSHNLSRTYKLAHERRKKNCAIMIMLFRHLHGLHVLLSLSINLNQSAFFLKIMHDRKKILPSSSHHFYG